MLSQSSLMTDSVNETHNTSATSGPETSNSVCTNSVNRSTDDRILQYQLSRPTIPLREPTEVQARVNPPKITRFIPTKPDKVLDAPEIINDYYLNILDWSADFTIAVALDRDVYLWNARSGSIKLLMSAGLEGEHITSVSGLIWNQEYRELITGHGDGKLTLWKYPSISKVKDLSEHQDRVLSIASSPDHEMVASCSADETIRIWNCFKVDHAKKRQEEKDLQRGFSLPKIMR
nr:unnamed protein product [Spirometra erinaceieuropaei]